MQEGSIYMYSTGKYKNKIYYELIKEEEPRELLLLVHPLGMSHNVWGNINSYFKNDYDILKIDLPGHGNSPDALMQDTWSISLLAIVIMDLVQSLGYQQTHYIGTSIGGAIGQELLLSSPAFLLSMMITNTDSKIGEESAWKLRAHNVREAGLSIVAKDIVPRWFAPAYLQKNPEQVMDWEKALKNTGNEGYAQLCEALASWSSVDRLKDRKDTVPILCVAGSKDPAMPLENMKRLANLIGDNPLKIMPVGHVPSVEAPDEFNQLLKNWLESIKK